MADRTYAGSEVFPTELPLAHEGAVAQVFSLEEGQGLLENAPPQEPPVEEAVLEEEFEEELIIEDFTIDGICGVY